MLATATYLDELNPEQCRAVEHGTSHDCTIGPPLLVIAGAGSGKTNTLAHRVANLIVNGAASSRILLMTFLRRAAAEMTRRVARIAAKLGRNGSLVSDSLAWAATFHAIGARLMTTMLNALEQAGVRYGLQTMCEAGGMANATIIERI